MAETAGTKIEGTYVYQGPTTGEEVRTMRVIGPAVFGGQNVIRTESRVTGTLTTAGAGTNTFTTDVVSYTRRLAPYQNTLYGLDTTTTAQTTVMGITQTSAFTLRSVLSPPFVDRRFTLFGQNDITQTQTGVATFTVTAPTALAPVEQPVNNTTRVRYEGLQIVDVPAGRYLACQFEETDLTTFAVTRIWVTRVHGIQLRTETIGPNGVQYVSARSIRLNDVPVLP